MGGDFSEAQRILATGAQTQTHRHAGVVAFARVALEDTDRQLLQ